MKNIEKVNKWKEYHDLTFAWKHYRLILIGKKDKNSLIYKLNISNLSQSLLPYLHYQFTNEEPKSYEISDLKKQKKKKKKKKKGHRRGGRKCNKNKNKNKDNSK